MNKGAFITAKQGTKWAYLIITLNSLRQILQSEVTFGKGQTKIQDTLAAHGRKSVSTTSVLQFALSCPFTFNLSVHALPCQERKTLGRFI